MKKGSKTPWGSPSKSKSKRLLLAFKTAAASEVRGLEGSALAQNEGVMRSPWSPPHPQCWEVYPQNCPPPTRDHPLFPLTMSGFRGHIWRWDPGCESSLLHWPSLFSASTWKNLCCYCHKQCAQGTSRLVPGSCGNQGCSQG